MNQFTKFCEEMFGKWEDPAEKSNNLDTSLVGKSHIWLAIFTIPAKLPSSPLKIKSHFNIFIIAILLFW